MDSLSAPQYALPALRSTLCLILSVSLYCNTAGAEGEDEPAIDNRLDLTMAFFDGEGIDKLTGFVGYTRNFSQSLNLSARFAYAESLIDDEASYGIGDTSFTLSYLPQRQLTVGPWFPRIVGSGISVLLPTGDEAEGRGLGATVLTPFVGTLLPLGERLSLAPSLAYSHSLGKVFTGEDLRVGLLELGIGAVFDNGFWFRFYPGYVKDFVTDKTSFGTRTAIGYLLNERWGLTFNYIDLDFFRPGLVPIEGGQYERTYEITINYGF